MAVTESTVHKKHNVTLHYTWVISHYIYFT